MWSGGSKWHKWDLHVHVPGTVRENNYGPASDENIARFCEALHVSDVVAFGLTDYFRLSTVLAVRRRFRELHGDSKLLVPNLEVRVAAGGGEVKADAHVLFDPELSDQQIEAILSRIRCRYSTKVGGSRDAFLSDFAQEDVPEGLHIVELGELLKDVGVDRSRIMAVVPAGKDGFTFASASDLIKAKSAALRDTADAAFGNPTDAARHERERAQGSRWRGPVFAGSDSHSWSDLSERLGRSIEGSDRDSHVTWIKAARSWDGLRQTLADPDNRVALSATRPEHRRAGQVIRSFAFPPGSAYPQGPLDLNPGLIAIIGARSSGKSSLLAQIAHVADPAQSSSHILAAGREDG